MYSAIETRNFRLHHNIDALSKVPLEPEDYCKSWVPKLWNVQPDERGYRKACITEIARVTGISKNTINTWGAMFENCPDHVRRTLRWVDIVNKIRELTDFPIDLEQD